MSFIRIGLTGGPGCGKSEVGRIFSTFQDWHCLDADRICHEIYSEADSLFTHLLEERWGRAVIGADALPDRKFIAEKVFGDETERQWLNSVLHPEILRRLEDLAVRLEARFVLVEVPLLFETKWSPHMDKTIAVWSPPEIQMTRLLSRNWTREHAEKRMSAQFSAARKLELADYGIINRGSLDMLREQCRRLDRAIKQFFNK